MTENNCIEWTGRRTRDGYGISPMRHGEWRAHRVALAEKLGGPLPKGMHALHRCDNPPCVNPDHLFLGTHADNQADKARKGRAPRGEGHALAKLTDDAVRRLRAAWAARSPSIKSIARELGVDHKTALRAAKRLGWVHVE